MTLNSELKAQYNQIHFEMGVKYVMEMLELGLNGTNSDFTIKNEYNEVTDIIKITNQIAGNFLVDIVSYLEHRIIQSKFNVIWENIVGGKLKFLSDKKIKNKTNTFIISKSNNFWKTHQLIRTKMHILDPPIEPY